MRHALTTNSGSSANLLALSTLTSPNLKARALKPGDEVITVATGFPTTVNPSLQYGLVPVFVDVDIPTYNIRPDMIEAAVSERTRAIMIAHTLGNPFDLGEVMRVAKKHKLWVVEDCCDALGATYDGKLVGTFGDIAHPELLSRAPHHHGRGGRGLHGQDASAPDRRVDAGLGPGLLVRAGQGQHLRDAFRAGSSATALRLRPQVHVLAISATT